MLNYKHKENTNLCLNVKWKYGEGEVPVDKIRGGGGWREVLCSWMPTNLPSFRFVSAKPCFVFINLIIP